MAITHLVCIILVTIRKNLSKSTDFGSSVKMLCKFLRVTCYLTSLTLVLITAVHAKNRNSTHKYKDCDDLRSYLHIFENYRQLEYSVFFC